MIDRPGCLFNLPGLFFFITYEPGILPGMLFGLFETMLDSPGGPGIFELFAIPTGFEVPTARLEDLISDGDIRHAVEDGKGPATCRAGEGSGGSA